MEKEGGITQQTARVRKITDEREALGREIARLTEQKEQKDAEYEQTVAKLWEEYELTLSAAQELCVPFESGAELRRQVSEVRGKIKALGNVNVSAIEEYAEVSQRYEFLRAQVGDVETSKAELQKLIAGLSDEMRAMFSESFAAINRNFGRIFALSCSAAARRGCIWRTRPMCWAAASASRWRLRARSSATCRRCRAANRRWWPSPFISPFSV